MIVEALSTIKKINLINKRKFTTVAIDKNAEIFVIHIVTLSATPIIHIYLLHQI